MNLVLLALGIWIAFDGIVSATYFAKYVDKTTKNLADQAIRVVRMIVGAAVITISFLA